MKIAKIVLPLVTSTTFAVGFAAPTFADQLSIIPSVSDAMTTGGTMFTTTWDEAEDLNELKVKVRISPDFTTAALGQKPGNKSQKASRCATTFTMAQEYGGPTVNWGSQATWNRNTTSLTDAKAGVLAVINANKTVRMTNLTVWPHLLQVYRYDAATNTFACSGSGVMDADGTVSIGEYIAQDLGKAVSDLRYGTDYIVRMVTSQYLLWGFTDHFDTDTAADNATAEDVNWVKISYELDFAIYGQTSGSQIYYHSIEEAIAAGEKNIVINTDLVHAEGTLEIPADTTVTVLAGASFTVANGAEVVNHGVIDGDGEVAAAEPIIVDNEVVGGTGETVVILDGGVEHESVSQIVGASADFAEFVEQLSDDSIFFDLKNGGDCDGADCATTVTVGGVAPNTQYYLYHYEDDGSVEYVGAFWSDADGRISVEFLEFSGNVLTTAQIELTAATSEVAVAATPATGANYIEGDGVVRVEVVSFAALAVIVVLVALKKRPRARMRLR